MDPQHADSIIVHRRRCCLRSTAQLQLPFSRSFLAAIILICLMGATHADHAASRPTGRQHQRTNNHHHRQHVDVEVNMKKIADAHNIIATAAAAANIPSANATDDQQNGATSTAVPPGGGLKVCTFKLRRLGAAQFDGKITILMPVTEMAQVRRQAYMFNKLESRFRNAGYNRVQFVVVYPADTEEHFERRANSHEPAASFEGQFELTDPVFNVTVLRQLMPSSSFGDSAAQQHRQLFVPTAAYVFDQCGRFAYIIYEPWNSIQRPYVKAAILSTIYDEPCGRCENYPNPYPVRPSPPNVSSSIGNSIDRTHSAIPSTSTTPSSDVAVESTGATTATEASKSSTTPSSETPLLDAAVNVEAGGSSSIGNTNNDTTTATANPKRNVPLQLIATVPTETTTFLLPIRVVVPIVHAHREIVDQTMSETSMATDDPSKHYLKFNYIVMRSNDPAYHAHLPNDTPERLVLVEPSSAPLDAIETNNGTRNGNADVNTTTPTTTTTTASMMDATADVADAATVAAGEESSTESQVESSSWSSTSISATSPSTTRFASSSATPELHFVTDYGKRYVSLAGAAGISAAQRGDSTSATAATAAAEDNLGASPAVRSSEMPSERIPPSQNRFHREFVYLEDAVRLGKPRSSTGRMVGKQQVDDGSAHAAFETTVQEERAINEHYGKIIQWIQFSL